jgi:hypothetical protein
VLPNEDRAAFTAFEAALFEELAPDGALQAVLARQIVAAAWRLARADRIEAEILIFRDRGEGDLGVAVTRDANTAHALPTLLRYRGVAQAEFLRALKALQALQAEQAKLARARPDEGATVLAFAPAPHATGGTPRRRPNEPERRGHAARSAAAAAGGPDQTVSPGTTAGPGGGKAPPAASPPAPHPLEPNEPDGAATRDPRDARSTA